jgi:hypothetical protein
MALIACRDFQKGDLVLAEAPFVVVPACGDSIEESDRKLTHIIENLCAEDKARFYSLSDKHTNDGEEATIRGIVDTNGLPQGDATEDFIPSLAGMYELICRMNHSCVPNVHHQWNPVRGMQQLYAIRDIRNGDEITTCYFDTPGLTREERQEKTKLKWRFSCTCRWCSLTGEALEERNLLDTQIARLDLDILQLAQVDAPKAVRKARQRLESLRQDVCDTTELARTEFDAFQICMQAGGSLLAYAPRFIYDAYRHNVIARGPDAKQTAMFRSLLADPWSLVLPHSKCTLFEQRTGLQENNHNCSEKEEAIKQKTIEHAVELREEMRGDWLLARLDQAMAERLSRRISCSNSNICDNNCNSSSEQIIQARALLGRVVAIPAMKFGREWCLASFRHPKRAIVHGVLTALELSSRRDGHLKPSGGSTSSIASLSFRVKMIQTKEEYLFKVSEVRRWVLSVETAAVAADSEMIDHDDSD